MSSAGAAVRRIETAAEIVDSEFRAAARHLDLSSEIEAILSTPYREVQMRVPVRMDTGEIRLIDAFCVEHNAVRGPSLSALRFVPACDMERERARAQAATWECALVSVPFGGGSSSIACDASALSERELESVTRKFTARICPLLGVYKSIVVPGEETSSQTMQWVLDEYSRVQQCGCTPAGKPVAVGEALDFAESESLGLAVSVREVAARMRLELADARVIVVGMSKVVRKAAEKLAELGFKIVGICDEDRAAYSPQGIDVDEVLAGEFLAGRVGQNIGREELIGSDCDILVCATEGVVNDANARRVRARMIVEAAGFVTTRAADAALESSGIVVVPDLLARAGKSIAFYFEWEQNLEQVRVPEIRSLERLEAMMVQATQAVLDRADVLEVSLRSSAYCIAVERVAKLEKLNGKS